MEKSYPERPPRVCYPVMTQPDDLDLMPDKSRFTVDRALLARKWRSLDEATDAFLLYCCDVSQTPPPFPLNPLLGSFEAVTVTPPLEITATYSGAPLDGHLQFHTNIDGNKENILRALEVETSVPGFIEALYLAFHLPTKWAFGHGRYGRDYILLPTFQLLRHPEIRVFSDGFNVGNLRGKLDRPGGVRVARRKGKFYVSCIAIYDFGSIVDMTVRVAEGRAVALWPPEIIYESDRRIIY